MYQDLTLQNEGAAAVITFNRPDALNAFTRPMLVELKHALAAAEADETVTGIILTGEGRGFCSGMDMNALADMSAGGSGEERQVDLKADPGDSAMGDDYISGLTYMLTIRKPVIAALNGPAAGMGLSVALLCDMRFAADTVKLVTSFSGRGLIAEHGQSWILPRLVGPSRALDLLWSSRKLLAEEAKEMGLVDRVYPPQELLAAALDYIEQLAAQACPTSLMIMKRQVYRHLNMPLGEAMIETDKLMLESLARDDFKEGVASYMELRPPNFDKLEAG
jgi:enoyl-CoA hydratase/carnithine racemase